jgi:hypothetical protein
MSINPKTYEGIAYTLTDAAAQVTDDVAGALTELHKALIKDPDNLSRIADIYTKRVAQASRRWEKNWRRWADEDLANSYQQGVYHTDLELERLRESGVNLREPDHPIPDSQPLAGRIRVLTESRDIPSQIKSNFQDIPNHLTAYNVFRRAAYHHLEGTTLQIARASNDLYRDAAVQAMEKNFKETDIFTRRKLSQAMLDDFAQKGLQAITYSNGRKVSIEAYSEMVGRTMSGHAAVQGSLNRYAEHGYELVRVSAHFRACPLCVPWEGKVLSLEGSVSYPSLDEAINAGLFHPNCAHDISAYIPGLSPALEVRVDPAEQKLIDQYGYSEAQRIVYKAQQQQRYIERQIRSWKRRELTALDDVTKAKAHRKVLDWQHAIRKHVKENPFLRRPYVVGEGYVREAVKGWTRAVRVPSVAPTQQSFIQVIKSVPKKDLDWIKKQSSPNNLFPGPARRDYFSKLGFSRDEYDEMQRLLDSYGYGGVAQEKAVAQIIKELKDDSRLGQLLREQVRLEEGLNRWWLENASLTPEQKRIYRKGSIGHNIESWTSNIKGAHMGASGHIGWDHQMSFEEMRKRGYRILGGGSKMMGAPGEGEVTFIKTALVDGKKLRW